ncbi:FAD-binding molybdopterin dehydrogenase [Methylobacterium sp. Leaf99]|uniref:FAD binding domain-containing protein n=1 Tax=Methylobacterium sp. Leaf99 TaxID=1736251 RepID=UPI0006FA357D|nr:FAD binding domain-containing protein [Methylobacterium sp. Leaf99]KQP03464.1 FAD-binding molybdopterin dehydrogenase [Methylobacterium sp. Leaf99]
MDLNGVTSVITPGTADALPAWRTGDAWLAGGTWLFSEPQPHLRRLIDIAALGWPPHAVSANGLTLAATCTLADLDRLDLPGAWIAAPLVGRCCRALLGSFKIWNRATVGGNLCMALPAGPMIALTAALDGRCTIRAPDGSERHLTVLDFVLGPQRTALRPGEILRSIALPAAAVTRRTAFRRISLSPNGRSGALLIGTLDRSGALALTVTASTPRPVRIAFDGPPTPEALRAGIAAAIPEADWYDDVHGAPDWRRHVTGLLAEEIRRELAP